MSSYMCTVVLLIVVCVDGFNNISQMPTPMPDYEVDEALGHWFAVYRKPSKGWPSTRDDTNRNYFLSEKRDNFLGYHLLFGKKQCTEYFGNIAVLKPPSVHLTMTTAGMLTSKLVMVGSDYERYLVFWGCRIEFLTGNNCSDPYIMVLTRTPTPDMNTIVAVNAVLMNMWGKTVHDLHEILHNGVCHIGPKNASTLN